MYKIQLSTLQKEDYSLKPYYSIDDARFEWLHEFIHYFKLRKESIEESNNANYTENARSQMFISWQSYEGLHITVFSFKEICKFLLEHGAPYILSERFSQDDVEITSVDNVPSVEDVTIQQFEILFIMIIPLNYNIQLDQLLQMFDDLLQNSKKLLQSPY